MAQVTMTPTTSSPRVSLVPNYTDGYVRRRCTHIDPFQTPRHKLLLDQTESKVDVAYKQGLTPQSLPQL